MANNKLWPTLRTQMTRSVKVRADDPRGHKCNLEEVVAVRMLPTPTARDFKTGHKGTDKDAKLTPSGHGCQLNDLVDGGKLNPEFVEWLMNFPKGWTSLEPMELSDMETWRSEIPWIAGEWEGVPRVAVGVKNRVDRLKAIGNGQVPQVAAAAWNLLTGNDYSNK
jgi:hypothetical protein